MKSRNLGLVLWVGAVVLLLAPSCVRADVPEPNLAFREVNISGSEFIVLQNSGTGDVTDLSSFWLGYTSDGSATSTAVPVQQLPAVPLLAGQVLLLTGGGTLSVCDANLIVGLSTSLSNSGGKLALWQQSDDSFTKLATPGTGVWWGKPAEGTPLASGEVDIKDETSQYKNPVWYFDAANGWELTDMAGCQLDTYKASGDTAGTQIASWPPNTANPPAVILSLATRSDASDKPHVPAADIGLKPPQLTELLPNPAEPQTDDADEFIELYNSNNQPFSLEGFTLQAGGTAKHSFVFPAGVKIPAESFRAFYSSGTGLSLSNSGGQADLLDPFGTEISKTDFYSNAKDGLDWALANGTWYWTDRLTPNAPNVINQAGPSQKAAETKFDKKLTNGVTKGASTVSKSDTQDTGDFSSETPARAPIHSGILAAVAAAAVAYGLYEYRHDVANKFQQFRKYRAARRKTRQ